jgi:hypothetical protein
MKFSILMILQVLMLGIITFSCKDVEKTINKEAEITAISRVIDSCIGWFKIKDFELLFIAVAHDSNYLSVHPTDNIIRGFEQFEKNSGIFKHPNFQYVRHEINDLTITLSRSGDIAWFYSVLNDINTWKGQAANWEDTR